MNRHAGALGLGLVLLLGACSTSHGNDRKASDAATTTTTPAPATTTSTSVATTATSAPEPRVERALADLLQRRNQAFSAPDPARAADYLTIDCSCYGPEQTSLTTLRDRGWHWETPMFEVLGVRLAHQSRADLVTLTVVARRPPERVVDSSGTLAKPQGPGLAPTGFSYVLTRFNGGWRIADNLQLDLNPDLIRTISEEGIPS